MRVRERGSEDMLREEVRDRTREGGRTKVPE